MNQNGGYHRDRVRFLTSNLVIHESTMLLERKIGRREVIRFLSSVTADLSVEIVHADPEIVRDDEPEWLLAPLQF